MVVIYFLLSEIKLNIVRRVLNGNQGDKKKWYERVIGY